MIPLFLQYLMETLETTSTYVYECVLSLSQRDKAV